MIAIGECAQFIVLGPIVADLAPPHLLGRYMSLYGLTFTAGVALGPAVGGALLATSPDAVWWGGALTVALTGGQLAARTSILPISAGFDELELDPRLQTRQMRSSASPGRGS